MTIAILTTRCSCLTFTKFASNCTIGVRAIESVRAKALYLRVQCLAQPADLALRDAAHAKRLDQVVHAPRANAVDIRLLDHGNQRPLTAAAWLQHCRVIATVANTRDPQFDTANARVPAPIAIPVTLAAPSRRALVLIRTDMLGDFHFHQLLRHQPDALTQKIHVVLELGLAQELEKRHPQILGHRLVSPFSEISTIPMGTAGGRRRHRPMSIPDRKSTRLNSSH